MPNNGKFHKSFVDIKGIIKEVLTTNGDLFAQLSIIDEMGGTFAKYKKGRLPKQISNQIALWFIDGKTEAGVKASVKADDKVHVTGYLRKFVKSETIALSRDDKKFDRIEDPEFVMGVMRDVAYLAVNTLIKVID